MAKHLIVRRLAGSDLGWFAAPRRLGKAKGRQRGINFNATEMAKIFPQQILETGNIHVISRRLVDGQEQARRIRRQEKNWRLVGDMVDGDGLESIEEDDLFIAEIDAGSGPPFSLVWEVVSAARHPELYARICRDFRNHLDGGMTSWAGTDPEACMLAELVGFRPPPAPPAPAERGPSVPLPEKPPPLSSYPLPKTMTTVRKRARLEGRLSRPHILSEIMRSGLALSARAQTEYIDALDTLSVAIRDLVVPKGLIRKVEIDHGKTWKEFRGRKIGFVDGGMANVSAVGAAPVAIRVGSYTVVPGSSGPDREAFDFEIQLVDELYQASGRAGVFEDVFEDAAKLRDVARICCEVGGVLSLSAKKDRPSIILLHGPLVNPVSPYALDGFPDFTPETVRKLLPGSEGRSGREANFVNVYLEQLKRVAAGDVTVCGVVERASSASPGPAAHALIERLVSAGHIDMTTGRQFLETMRQYKVTDSVLFECVLDEGEYLEPVEVDKQGPGSKIPDSWRMEINAYPRPLITYAKSSQETMPVRVESFPSPLAHEPLMKLVVHMSRLLPRYSFPVGLDIVDKHAKVPEWMSRQVNAMMSAQLMRKAMDTGNPAAVRMVRRILSANTRDWLFRPDFRKG